MHTFFTIVENVSEGLFFGYCSNLVYFLIFVFGLIVGSFLNCVIYRLGAGGSFLKGRSFCPHCKHTLSWPDLIPLFSFFLLKGKCRYCQKPISWQYPLVELTTGILFLLIIHYTFPNFLLSIFYSLISSFLIVIFVYDLEHYIIPDKVIYPAIIITFVFNILNSYLLNHKSILSPLLAALGASAFFLTIVLMSRGKWMGWGDVKLAFLMGLFLGYPNILVALFLAFFIGAIVGLILIALGKKTLKSEIPFGPFLVTGTFLAIFLGEKILNWYLNLFLLK